MITTKQDEELMRQAALGHRLRVSMSAGGVLNVHNIVPQDDGGDDDADVISAMTAPDVVEVCQTRRADQQRSEADGLFVASDQQRSDAAVRLFSGADLEVQAQRRREVSRELALAAHARQQVLHTHDADDLAAIQAMTPPDIVQACQARRAGHADQQQPAVHRARTEDDDIIDAMTPPDIASILQRRR